MDYTHYLKSRIFSYFSEALLYSAIFWFCLSPDLNSTALLWGTFCWVSVRCLTSKFLHTLSVAVNAALVTFFYWLRQYEAIYGRPDQNAYATLFQSNPSEAGNYFFSVAPFDVLFPAIILLLLVTSFNLYYRVHKKTHVSYPRVVCGVVMLAFALLFVLSQRNTFPERAETLIKTYSHYKKMLQEQNAFAADVMNAVRSNPRNVKPADFSGNLVFILGESTTRRHMSLYGYFRDTTPNLDKLQSRLLVHHDTISSHTHTVPALMDMLTGTYPDDPDYRTTLEKNIVTLLRDSGMEVFWFTNQKATGVWENPISVFAKLSNHHVFLNTSLFKQNSPDAYDHHMVPLVRKALLESKGKRVIFMHTHTAHSNYCYNLPEKFKTPLRKSQLGAAFFGREKNLSEMTNCYDKNIYYLDTIISDVIKSASEISAPTIVYFMPDHGENPLNYTAHNAMKHSAYQVEIPHIVYFNEAARSKYPNKLATFSKHIHSAYHSGYTLHTIMDLLDADTSLYDASRSLFSEKYTAPENRRSLVTQNMYWDFDEKLEKPKELHYDSLLAGDAKDHLEIARVGLNRIKSNRPEVYSKIWAHRTNTIGALMEAAPLFAGVELDIVYKQKPNKFFVYHPGTKSTGLTLHRYLSIARSKYPDIRFWLDWKNATTENLPAALARLDHLDDLFAFKDKAYIETSTGAVSPKFRMLSERGYKHVYYSPQKAAEACYKDTFSQSCTDLAISISNTAKRLNVKAISFSARGLKFARSHRQHFAGLEILAWDLESRTEKPELYEDFPKSDDLSVFLVNFPSLYKK